MVKGTKRQIIFLPNLKESGKGIFECAYFILRSECGDGVTAENEMLAEAEKIVAAAERLRAAAGAGRGVVVTRQKERSGHSECRKRQLTHRFLAFLLGFFAGIAVAAIAVAIWRMENT